MKLSGIFIIVGIAFFLFSCGNQNHGLNVINSGSFPERNIILDPSISQRLMTDSVKNNSGSNKLDEKLDRLISFAEGLGKNPSDSIWNKLSANWYDIMKDGLSVLTADSIVDSDALSIAGKWADLNIILLKLSGEVKFADAIDELFFKFPSLVLTEKQLKSIIYTHIDDQIYINMFISSNLTHQHTTGGIIKLLQETSFPESNKIILKCESDDVRYLDVFIRIPEWAVNPTVSHGNVKYVAHAGEYCQISRKWQNGDEFQIVLKN